jgi:hypothetical protein
VDLDDQLPVQVGRDLDAMLPTGADQLVDDLLYPLLNHAGHGTDATFPRY